MKNLTTQSPTTMAKSSSSNPMLPADKVIDSMSAGRGFDAIQHIPGSTYQDNRTIIIAPTRGMIHHRVVTAWQSLIGPPNQTRHFMMVVGHEVGKAYNDAISQILAHPDLSKWPYIMTLEDDNLPPPDAHVRLLETIEWGKYDAVSGIYFTKGEFPMPMAYGDPADFKRTGILDFKPRDVRAAIAKGNIMPVNGIAMGCALWRTQMFKKLPPPWFQTFADLTPQGAQLYTQDLWGCKRFVENGCTFAVDFRVRVGHMDVNTGIVY